MVPFPALALRGGLTLFGTVGAFDMTSLNDVLNVLNAEYEVDRQPVRFDPIDSGVSYGVGLHSPLGERLLVGLEWERLAASTDVGGPLDKNRIDAEADVYGASFMIDFVPRSKFRFGFEGALGYLSSRSAQTIFANDVQILKTDLDGSSATYRLSLAFGVPATASLDFSVGLGWRWAKVTDLGGQLTTNIRESLTAPPVFHPLDSLDWSGVYGRAAVTLFVF
ncbi:MAG: hypothetical protein ACRDGR_02550 [bacterium]